MDGAASRTRGIRVEGGGLAQAPAAIPPIPPIPPIKDARLMPLLVDAGILYAMADRSDAWHDRTVDYLKQFRPALLAPVTVLPEAACLVRTRLGEREERKLIEGFVNGGVALESLRDADLARIDVLMAKYTDLGFTDCSLVAMAERLALDTIATTDRRHFAQVRPRHLKRFSLVP